MPLINTYKHTIVEIRLLIDIIRGTLISILFLWKIDNTDKAIANKQGTANISN